METSYGDPLVRTTPFHLIPANLKDALGGEYNWASWLQHPLSGFGLHFFLKAFELGKLTGNYLVELNHKPKVYCTLTFTAHPGRIMRKGFLMVSLACSINSLMPRRWSSGHSFQRLASVDRTRMILGHANQRRMKQTMPRSLRHTMLSSWKGMCT